MAFTSFENCELGINLVKLSNNPSLLGLAVRILSKTSLSVETGITSIISLYLNLVIHLGHS